MAPPEWLPATVGPETVLTWGHQLKCSMLLHVGPSAEVLHPPPRGLSPWLLVPPHSVVSQDSLISKSTHVKAARPS